MAEKITLEEFEKRKKEGKIGKKEKNKLLWPLRIFIILFGIAGITIGVLIFFYNKELNSKDAEITRLDDAVDYWKDLAKDSDKLDMIVGNQDPYYVKNKLDFYDENIVFVVEGYGNYYYTYDCMKQKVGNNAFSFYAFNTETARAKGYYEGGCN